MQAYHSKQFITVLARLRLADFGAAAPFMPPSPRHLWHSHGVKRIHPVQPSAPDASILKRLGASNHNEAPECTFKLRLSAYVRKDACKSPYVTKLGMAYACDICCVVHVTHLCIDGCIDWLCDSGCIRVSTIEGMREVPDGQERRSGFNGTHIWF